MSSHRAPDRLALQRSLNDLRALPAEHGLRASLQQVLDAARHLFDADGTGFMMVDPDAVLNGVAATDEPGRVLETSQQELGEGPCVDTLTFDRVVVVHDFHTDDRWPRLRPLLPEQIVSLIGVPVRVAGGAVGALNVYRSRPAPWSEDERLALEAYARLLEGFLVTALEARQREQLAEQLQHALDHRVTIDRAVGAIMARDRTDPVGAFNKLRADARSAQRKVVDVAAELLSDLSGGA
jgi:GAF domain-containing protein